MKKVRVKSPVPIYAVAALWLLMGLVAPMYRLWAVALTLALSAAVYAAASRFFPGQEVEVQSRADSGNAGVDRQIEEGREMIRRIHEANEAIPDPDISARLARMEKAGYAIFDALEKDVSRASQVRRFMTYYLPTTDKLLARYRELRAVGVQGSNVSGAMKIIGDSMEMIAVAFEKQLDALYRDSALDVESDIEVLETIIKAEGHDGKGMTLGGK